MKFRIIGKKWKLKVLSDKQYIKKNGPGSVGITHLTKRQIHLSSEGTDKETIIHELLHAYMAELCNYTADLEEDQLEEVFAEILSKRGYEMLCLAEDLFWKVKRKGKKK